MKAWWNERKDQPLWWIQWHVGATMFWTMLGLFVILTAIARSTSWIPATINVLICVGFVASNTWRRQVWTARYKFASAKRDMWLIDQAMLHLRDCQGCQENVLASPQKCEFDSDVQHKVSKLLKETA